jgi:nucleotide-binding universal stress UspA family protein
MKILAAVDVHEPMGPVLERIVPWAQRLGVVVDLGFASKWPTDSFPVGHPAGDELDRLFAEWRQRAAAEQTLLADALQLLPVEVRGVARVFAGPVPEVIHDVAAPYDLVAVVTHQRTGVARFLSGSLAARIVRTCPVPVMVMGLGDPVPDPSGTLYVLAPVDYVGLGALPWIKGHLPFHRTEAAHIHDQAVPIWVAGTPHTVFVPPPTRAIREEMERRLVEGGFAGVALHFVESLRNPADELVQVAKNLGVDLIVMQTHGRRGITRAVLGSVAERVAERAHCAVVVVGPDVDPVAG